MAESLSLRGTLEGHKDWVTSIATPLDPNSDTILSASRWVHAGMCYIGSQLQPCSACRFFLITAEAYG